MRISGTFGNKSEWPALLLLTLRKSNQEGRFPVMMSKTIAALAATAVICASSIAFGQMAPAKIADTSKGKALVDSKGMTLYTFDKDTGGKSMCNGPCAENWPPLMANADAKPSGEWTVVTRDDGKMMWAYKGKPLYTWKKDSAPGNTTGDGFNNGVWHVATP
jgi:predicted lipoprotein with Yx(FWY)xxD motif